MIRQHSVVLVLACLWCAAQAHAQAAQPRGPADVMKQAQQARAARDKKPLDKAAQPSTAPSALPAGHPAVTPGAEAADENPQGELPPGHPAVAPGAEAAGGNVGNAGNVPGELPPGHPALPAGGEQAGEDEPIGDEAGGGMGGGGMPSGGDPHAGVEGAPALNSTVATAQPSHDVPVGSIRVQVVDEQQKPVAGAMLMLGTMSQQSGRTSIAGSTGADGSFTFEKLAPGEAIAYRVNLLYQGAKFSSTPFRLPVDQGYDVVVRRQETTHEDREIAMYIGATSLELKDDRVKVVQQVRLFNVGKKTYVFPEAGLLVRLPADAVAFQAEEVMTDQHLAEVPSQGFKLTGSLPSGEAMLTWGFDVPLHGTELDLSFPLPWPAFSYRVIADAASGMSLTVDELPAPEHQQDEGHKYLVTELQRSQGQEPLRSVQIHLRGIPGPGPMRFIAVSLGLLILALGVVLAVRAPQRTQKQDAQSLADQKQELLDRATRLQAEHDQGEIGPEFYAQTLGELEEELAGLLHEQQKLG